MGGKSEVMEKNTKETSSTLATRKNATLAAKSSASIKEKTTAEIVAVPTREKVTAVAMEAAELIKEKEKTTMTITETAETAEKKHVNGIYHTFNNKKKITRYAGFNYFNFLAAVMKNKRKGSDDLNNKHPSKIQWSSSQDESEALDNCQLALLKRENDYEKFY